MRQNQAVIWKHGEPNTSSHRGHLDVGPGPTAQLCLQRLAEKGSENHRGLVFLEEREAGLQLMARTLLHLMAPSTPTRRPPTYTHTNTPHFHRLLPQQSAACTPLWGKCYSCTRTRRYVEVPASCF